MDKSLLARYWAAYPSSRAAVPDEIADRIMIFHRGVDVANMQGRYVSQKIDTLISYWLLQPIYRLVVMVAQLVGGGWECVCVCVRGRGRGGGARGHPTPLHPPTHPRPTPPTCRSWG